MAAGPTLATSLNSALPTVIDAARIVREFTGVMVRLSERHNLADNQGLNWDEFSLDQLSAQRVTETTELENPQQISGSLLTITPTVVGVQTIITDRTMRRISKNVAARIGVLQQNAMQRLKDEDGLTVLDGATTSLAGAGSTLSFGHISAATTRIAADANEPGNPPYYAVLHGHQVKDIEDELQAGIGTYPTQGGLTESVFRSGFAGSIASAEVFVDGNITVDSADDAKGGVFAREAILLIDGFGPREENQRLIRYGGGAHEVILYDEYQYGERSAGNWLYEIYSDATAPSS